MSYQAYLTKEEWEQIEPRAQHPNPIKMCTTVQSVSAAVRALRKEKYVGIDTESRPVFVKGEKSELSLIQLSSPTCTYLIRVNMLGITPSLRQFLEDPSIIKVGLSLRDDSSAIYRKARFRPQSLVDLQLLCPAYGIHEKSLRKIYAILFGEKISKSQQLTNWDQPQLTPAQQHYAALDSWACLRIFDKLKQEPMPLLEQFGRVLFDE